MGGWASGTGQGISVYRFNPSNGSLKFIKMFPESECGPNPTAFRVNERTRCMYICNEFDNQSSVTKSILIRGMHSKQSVFSQSTHMEMIRVLLPWIRQRSTSMLPIMEAMKKPHSRFIKSTN